MLLSDFEGEVEVVEVITLATKGDTNNETFSTTEVACKVCLHRSSSQSSAPPGRPLKGVKFSLPTREGAGRLGPLGVD